MKKSFAKNVGSLNRKKGFTLVESMIYLAILVFLLVGVINAVMTLTSMYRKVRVVKSVESSAIALMDRIIRETRNAESVYPAQTSWNISSGSLALNTTDSAGNASIVRFYVATGTMRSMLEENGVNLGPLTDSNVRVSSLLFRSYSTSTSAAVKIEMTLESASTTPLYVLKNFYGTAVLRGSYQ